MQSALAHGKIAARTTLNHNSNWQVIQLMVDVIFESMQVDYSHIKDADYWLTDKEIDRALQLIAEQWPDIKTQSTLHIQQPNGFDAAVSCGHGQYCQVLHMAAEKHWVAVTNVGGKGKVRLFDSLGLTISDNVKKAVASE